MDPQLFWKLTLREIKVILDGAGLRLKREHNSNAWAVWHMAFLSSYVPEKPSNFVRLSKLLWNDPSRPKQQPDWQRSEQAFAAWAKSYTR